ncbi:nSTAND1 domain-containing NTPase [Sorangium sp. So ce1182]|uniref:nSTAND1 domain-containing NTPase n=1 Tax=Sorangium sp. So ce1182 TaxID=3133334 RepID=UPI003F5DD98F
MSDTSQRVEGTTSEPRDVVLELVRAARADRPFAFSPREEAYLRRLDTGAARDAPFPWSEEVLRYLAVLYQTDLPDPTVAARVGEALRAFLDRLGWDRDEAEIERALPGRQPVHLTLRLGAAELYALPWELVPLRSSGRSLGSLPGCLIRHEWPATTTAAPALDPPPEGGRILVAWSASGGEVPAADHIAALRTACRAGHHPFDEASDVLPHASLARLQAALRARPAAVLHLLCHGVRLDAASEAYGLALDADEGGGDDKVIDARTVQEALAEHAGSLRLVVLCVCHGGNPGALGNRLGSVAQELHRVGIPAVVASRYPLSFDASIALAEALYRGLLARGTSLEDAFLTARDALRDRRLGWASLQLFARAADGPDHRPIVARPYRGLLAFHTAHARYFCGRDREVEEALADLLSLVEARDPGRHRFLVVTGASGTGKSSLVLAGVVPILLSRDRSWSVATMRPAAGWEAALSAALARKAEGAPLLVVVDQFEEIFTSIADKGSREAFVRELFRISGAPGSGVAVVVTLRVDFLARCAEIALDDGGLTFEDVAYDEAHRVFIRAMKADGLREIIARPAAISGLALEEGLIEQMLRDAGAEPGALPLLEYALDQMWQRRRGGTLTWDAYHALGGAFGALEKQADALLAGLDEVRQRAARRLLVQLVMAGDDGGALDRRRRAPVGKLRRGPPAEAAVFDEVLEALARERLLVLSEGDDGGAPIVEVAHEQLLRAWGRLRSWMNEDRTMLAELQQIDRWVEEAKGFPDLVLEGDRLGHARELLKRYPDDIGDAARELLARSEALAERRAREAEAQRQRERRYTRLSRLAAIVGLAAAAVIGVLAVLMLVQWRAAKEAARVAKEAAEQARVASLIAGIREHIARGQGAPASRLLLEVEPEAFRGWSEIAREVLASPMPLMTLRPPDGDAASPSEVAVVYSPDGQRLLVRRGDDALVLRADGAGALSLREDGISCAAWSPDGRWLALGGSSGDVGYSSDGGAGKLLWLQRRHTGRVTSVAWSPDGRQLATAAEDRTVHVWSDDLAGGPAVLALTGEATRGVNYLAWSPDGRLLIAVSREGAVNLWGDGGAGEPAALMLTGAAGHESALDSVVLSPDGRRLLTTNGDDTARIWNLYAAPVPLVLKGRTWGITLGVFSPDGRRVAFVSSQDSTVEVRDADGTGEPLVLRGHSRKISAVAFSPDGQRIVTASEDGTARVWRSDGAGEALVLRAHDASVVSAAWSPDGRRIATASSDGTVRFWSSELVNGAILLRRSESSHMQAASFSPDGQRIVVMDSWTPWIVRVDGTGTPTSLKGDRAVSSAAWSPDGQRIVTAYVDGSARVWRSDGVGEPVVLRERTKRVFSSSAVFSPDGGRILMAPASTYDHGMLVVFRADGAGEPVVLKEYTTGVTSAVFSPDGSRILTAYKTGIVVVFRTDGAGEPIQLNRRRLPWLDGAAWSPDGRRVATSGSEMALWSADGPGEPLAVLGKADGKADALAPAVGNADAPAPATPSARAPATPSAPAPATSSAPAPATPSARRPTRIASPSSVVLRPPPPPTFSPDGQRVVFPSGGIAQVWRADGAGEPVVLGGHADVITSAAWSPDGQRIVTASGDGTARVWSASGAGEPVVLGGHADVITSAAWSPDGQRIVTASEDRTVRVWRGISVPALQELLRGATSDCLSPMLRTTYLGETDAEARQRHDACERSHGREPPLRSAGERP